MPLADDDRRALASRLATTAPAAVEVLAATVDDDEELREVMVDVDGEVVALTNRRVLFVGVGADAGVARPFGYDALDVRRRGEGLGVDATAVGDRLVLEVARSTFVRLGVVAEGNPPGRASWLPARNAALGAAPPDSTEVPTSAHDATQRDVTPTAPTAPPVPPRSALPPPGWHPDPSGRHWWRWWDGRGWTDHVADGGAPYVDPLPPR